MMDESQFRKIDPYDWFCGLGSQMSGLYVSVLCRVCVMSKSKSQSQLYCQFCHMYRTYIQRIEIALLSYSLVHTDNTKH